MAFVLFATVRFMLESVGHLVAHELISGDEFLRNLFIQAMVVCSFSCLIGTLLYLRTFKVEA